MSIMPVPSTTPTHLELVFLDAYENEIDMLVLPVFAALEAMARFALGHGTAPYEAGRAAAAGTIRFRPVHGGPAPTVTQGKIGDAMSAMLEAGDALDWFDGRRTGGGVA